MKLAMEIQMYDAADAIYEDREVALAGINQELIDDDVAFLKELLEGWGE